MIFIISLILLITLSLPRPYGSVFCMAVAALFCARLVVRERRLRRQYEEVFGRPVPVGRTADDLEKILDRHRTEKKRGPSR